MTDDSKADRSEDRGKASEDLVERICGRLFFRDFVVRSPKFRKPRGQEKEAADVLVLADKTLVVIQVKARPVGEPDSSVALGRLEKRIADGVAQLKTLRRAIDAKHLTHVTTLRGIEVPLPLSTELRLVGVVVLDILDEDEYEIEKRPTILGGFDSVGETPAHIFTRSTFERLAEELDTLPDFLGYLDARHELYSRRVLTSINEELDFLALYKTNHPLVQEAIDEKYDLLIISEGTWEDYQATQKEARAKRAVANEPSYLVDEMIEYFHTSLDAPADIPGLDPSFTRPTDLIEAYMVVTSELARLTRVQRRALGEKVLEKLRAAKTKPVAYAVMADPSSDSAVFFLCTDKPRAERLRALRNLTLAAAHRVGVSRIIGIATESDGATERTFDALAYRDLSPDPEDAEQLRALADQAFGPMNRVTRQEWE